MEKIIDGWTALHIATSFGHEKCVQALLCHEAILVNEKTNDGWTAFHIAASHGRIECLEALLNSPHVNVINERTPYGWNELNYPALCGYHRFRFNKNGNGR